MNICLIGYGRMGHEIESIALKRGHTIRLIIDQENISDLNDINRKGVDVAIEFSSPQTAFSNIIKCLNLKVPVVSGTTGWLKDLGKAAEICIQNGTSFIHSSNFSVGVNILFKLNTELANLTEHYKEYLPSVEEIHHINKLDAPSGTAISLAEGIIRQNNMYTGWCSEKDKEENLIPIFSVREGAVTGIHKVIWDSETDIISIQHEAKNRKGFALGAVIAAEFISTRKGVFTINDVLGF